jgi:hypothetical protein
MYHAVTVIEDAEYAAERIPPTISATQAACQFLEHFYKDAPETDVPKPKWFLRG